MRYLLCLACSVLAACTSFVETEAHQGNLQRDIRAGEIIVPGDEIRVTTTDQSVFEFTVSEITDDRIEGEGSSVSISSVETLEIRRLSPERAVMVTAGSLLVSWWLIGLLLSMIVFIPA